MSAYGTSRKKAALPLSGRYQTFTGLRSRAEFDPDANFRTFESDQAQKQREGKFGPARPRLRSSGISGSVAKRWLVRHRSYLRCFGNDWAYRIIKHMGNYGESFERN